MDAGTSSRPWAAIHNVLLLDCSTSIRMHGLTPAIVDGVNEVLGVLREAKSQVSVVFFSASVAVVDWRKPAVEVEPFSVETYPADGGTSLYDAIGEVLRRLEEERSSSHGELNAPDCVHLLVFTDGEDRCSRKMTRLEARLALVQAGKRGWKITFMSAVPGLAADLGIHDGDTRQVDMDPRSVRNGFREVTRHLELSQYRAAMEAVRPSITPAAASPGGPALPPLPERPPVPPTVRTSVLPDQPADQAPAPPPAAPAAPSPVPPPRRPWWKWWGG